MCLIEQLVVQDMVQKLSSFDEKKKARKKKIYDPVYNDMCCKFINYIMERGKKGIAEKIFMVL